MGGFFDGHPVVNWRHDARLQTSQPSTDDYDEARAQTELLSPPQENLMRLFFRALRSFMKVGGLVKAFGSGDFPESTCGMHHASFLCC